METQEFTFTGWAILELMGHRRLAGFVTPTILGSTVLLQVNIPGSNKDDFTSQFYNPSALYCLTPTTEDVCIAFSQSNQPAPVKRWELPTSTQQHSNSDEEFEQDED